MPTLTELVKANTEARGFIIHDYQSIADGFTVSQENLFRVNQQDRVFNITGSIGKATPSTISSGFIIATLPVAVRPTQKVYFAVPVSIVNQAEPFNALCLLDTNGEISFVNNIALSAFAFYFNCTYIK